MAKQTPTPEDRATAAINRRRAAGMFGRTDALEFALGRYRVDLSEWLRDGGAKADAAEAAVGIAVDVLERNAKAASKARKVQAEMARVIEYAEVNAVQNVPMFGPIDLSDHVELAAYVAEVGALLRSLDKAMEQFLARG